ncbi:hypothetical protein [Fibrobacter succinogenes]|uniref:hypothetical protein n=1 Tax=Fibrobacter succinogenes TaxID=833 RepID=UPI0013D0B28C|nr:hypothetical protein [Fibrobacter succinogenes]
MLKRLGFVFLFVLMSYASASGISWKTIDVKVGPFIGGWNDVSTTMTGLSLSVVKPVTSFIGVGVVAEFGTSASECEDCMEYEFKELSEGVLVNFNYPIWGGFTIVTNFMFLVDFQDGSYAGIDGVVRTDAFDEEGNRFDAYQYEYDEGDYYRESFMFRSSLGFAWRTKSNVFGLEFYPVNYAITEYDACLAFALNTVFRIF